MKSIVSTLIFIILMVPKSIHGQTVNCEYNIYSEGPYYCTLRINNPNGFNNITNIGGTHRPGKENADVTIVHVSSYSITTNFPSIICDTFGNIINLNIRNIGIERIDEHTFDNFKKLISLDLYTNNITTLPDNIFDKLVNLTDLIIGFNKITTISTEWFKNLENLRLLYLSGNEIEELPKNAFSSLKNLVEIFITNNKLKVIHSDAFGLMPKLVDFYVSTNQIDAIDEKFINNTAVIMINMEGNVCHNRLIRDNSPSRQGMRELLKNCFNNFNALSNQTTTVSPTTLPVTPPLTTIRPTLPPGCNDGNLDQRVCELELKNAILEQNFAELERKVLELSYRPCAC